MRDTPEIFEPGWDRNLKRYSKRVITGRVVLFLISGLSFLLAFPVALIEGPYDGMEPVPVSTMCLIAVPVLLFLGILSFKKPFVALLLGSIIVGLSTLACLFNLAGSAEFFEVAVWMSFVITGGLLLFFLMRGAVAARKKMKLLRQMGKA